MPLDNQNVQFLTTVKGALVAKTGYTDAAQHTFAGVIERNGHRYGVVLLRAQRYPDDQWVQATKLVDWGLALPKGTPPVGHLVVSARAAAPTTAAPGSGASSSGASGSGASTLRWRALERLRVQQRPARAAPGRAVRRPVRAGAAAAPTAAVRRWHEFAGTASAARRWVA